MRLPFDPDVGDASAGNMGLDIGSAGLHQDGSGGWQALGGPRGQRNLVPAAIEELDGGDAPEDARAGGSIAKQDRGGQLAAG